MAKKLVPLNRLSEEELEASRTSGGPQPEHPAANGVEGTDLGLSTDGLEIGTDIKRIEEILTSEDITGGKIRIDRKGPSDIGYQYIQKVEAAKFDIDWIKRVYGGGDYRCKAWRADGRMYKAFEFSIDYRFKGSMDETDIQAQARMAAGKPQLDTASLAQAITSAMPQPKDDNSMIEMMKMQAKSGESNMMLMMKMMEESSRQARESANQNLQMMMGMMTAIVGKPALPVDNGLNQIMMPLLIKMLDKKETPLAETIAAINQLKQLAETGTIVQPEKEETVLDKLIKYGTPAVAALLTGQKLTMPSPTGQLENAPLPPNQQPTQPQPPQTQPQMNMQQMKVSIFLNQCFVAADQNSDASLYGDMLLDSITEPEIVNLQGVLTADNWHVTLFGTNPDIIAAINASEQRKAWFEELRQYLIHFNDEPSHDERPAADNRPVAVEHISKGQPRGNTSSEDLASTKSE